MSRYLLAFLLNVFLKKRSSLCSSNLMVVTCRHEFQFCFFPPSELELVEGVVKGRKEGRTGCKGESSPSPAMPGTGSDPQGQELTATTGARDLRATAGPEGHHDGG